MVYVWIYNTRCKDWRTRYGIGEYYSRYDIRRMERPSIRKPPMRLFYGPKANLTRLTNRTVDKL